MDHFNVPVVLIVEDECLVRMLAVDTFRARGFTVLEAEDAAAAVEVYGVRRTIDLLFTDVNMPGELDGVGLAERFKQQSPTLKVIITSALPLARSVDHLSATFVPKPYNPETVCSEAMRLLAV